jgi:hypothetical protein
MLNLRIVILSVFLATTFIVAQGITKTEGRKLTYIEKSFEKVVTSDDYTFTLNVGGDYEPEMKRITITSNSGEVKNPTVLVNDGVDYTSVPKLGATLFKGLTTPKEKVFKMFHFNSAQNMADGYDPGERDPIKLFNIKGYGYCSHQNHETFAKFLVEHGVRSKMVDIYQHSVAEEYYDGGWHYFDVYKEFAPIKANGEVASYSDIKANPNIMVYAGDDYGMMPGGGFSTAWSAYAVKFGPATSGWERNSGNYYHVMKTTLNSGESKIRNWPKYENLIGMGNYDYAPASLPALSLGENSVYYYDDSNSRDVTIKYEWREVYDAGTTTPEWRTRKLTNNESVDAMYPRVAIDNSNVAHIVWEEINKTTGEGKVYYGVLDTLTNSIKNKKQVSVNGVYSCRPDICLDDTNGIHIVFMGNAKENNLYKRSVSEVGLNDIYYLSGDGSSFTTPKNLTETEWWHYFVYPRVFESDGKIHLFALAPKQSSTDYQGKPNDNQMLYAVSLHRWQRTKTGDTWGSSTIYSDESGGWMNNAVNYAKDHRDNIYRSISIYESKLKVAVEVNNPIESNLWFMTGMELYDPLGAAIGTNANNDDMYYAYSGKVNGYDNSIYLAVKNNGSWKENMLLSDDKNNKEVKCVYPQIAVGNNNKVQVVWQERDNTLFEIPRREKWRIAVKTFDGNEWKNKAIVSHFSNSDNKIPQVYIDNNNKAYIFWHGFSSGSGELYWSTEGEDLSDTEAPTPNPMSFSVEPFSTGATTVSMTASTASDPSGGIEYFFECTTDASHSSGWQSSASYIDSNVTYGEEYGYRVSARDALGNETRYSETKNVKAQKELFYLEADGKCVMEAENGTIICNGDSSGWSSPFNGSMEWYEAKTESGYSGSGYMTTENGVALNAAWENGTELSFPVYIGTVGDYYLAARKWSGTGDDDSAYMGVDNSQKGGKEFVTTETEFTWRHGTVSLGKLTKGMHNIQIRRREDGFMIDRIMIATSKGVLPSDGSTEVGPDESERVDTVVTSLLGDNAEISPTNFVLNAAYPNPFNPSTTISYALPKAEKVSIIIYDIMGRKVKTLVNKEQSAGNYSIAWNAINNNGNSVSTGIYLYRINAGEFSGIGKLLYVK